MRALAATIFLLPLLTLFIFATFFFESFFFAETRCFPVAGLGVVARRRSGAFFAMGLRLLDLGGAAFCALLRAGDVVDERFAAVAMHMLLYFVALVLV